MIKKVITKAHQHWKFFTDSDESLTILMAFLILYVFLIYPLSDSEIHNNSVASLGFGLVLLLGVMAIARRRSARLCMIVLAITAFTTHLLRFLMMSNTAHIVSASLSSIFFIMLVVFIMVRVFGKGSINRSRICGAIAAYILLGLVWTEFYVIIFLISPEAFYTNPSTNFGEPPISEMLYFSFVCLTTMGFGDIIPVSPLARSLVSLEGLLGQLYPAVLLARLVTLYNHQAK